MPLNIGPDFWAARHGWLYQANGGQPLLVASLAAFGIFVVYSILQGIFGYVAYAALNQDWAMQGLAEADGMAKFIKGSIIGLLPAALIGIGLTLLASRIDNRNGLSGLHLHVPALGAVGWFLVVAGFSVAIMVIYILTFNVLGIDPKDYAPTGDGNSQSGMIEKALADLADEPGLFALAIPGVAFAVPVAEEMIFRGAIFSALVNSPAGKSGAVLTTAALWAAIHGSTAPWLFVAIIFIMGIVLGLLLLRFGSLWVTIVCHCVWNGLTTLSIFGGTAGT